MKNAILFFLLLVLGLFLLGGVIKNIGVHHVLFAFSSFPWWGAATLIGLTAAGIVASIVRWQRILSWQGVHTEFWFLTRTWLGGYVATYLTPIPRVGGAPVRAGSLHKKYNIPFAQAMKSVAIDEISEATMWAFFIVAGIFFFLWRTGIPDLSKTFVLAIIIFSVALIGLVFVYAMSFQRKQIVGKLVTRFHMQNSKVGKGLQDFESDMIDFFHPGNPVLWEALGLSFFKHFVDLLRNVFVIFALGKGVQWGVGIISYMMFSIGYSLPVPGALGVQEAGQALTFGLLGLGPETGAALSLLIRGADVFFVLIGGVLLLHRGLEFLGVYKVLEIPILEDKDDIE